MLKSFVYKVRNTIPHTISHTKIEKYTNYFLGKRLNHILKFSIFNIHNIIWNAGCHKSWENRAYVVSLHQQIIQHYCDILSWFQISFKQFKSLLIHVSAKYDSFKILKVLNLRKITDAYKIIEVGALYVHAKLLSSSWQSAQENRQKKHKQK